MTGLDTNVLARFLLDDDAAEFARLALDDYRAGPGDFADALIAHAALDGGCEAVLTFDKSLKRMPGFRQL